MEGGKKNDLDQKRTTFSNQPDRLSLNRENQRKRFVVYFISTVGYDLCNML